MVQFLKQRIKWLFEFGQILAGFNLANHFLLNLFHVSVERIKVRAHFILHSLLEGIWFKFFNLVEICD